MSFDLLIPRSGEVFGIQLKTITTTTTTTTTTADEEEAPGEKFNDVEFNDLLELVPKLGRDRDALKAIEEEDLREAIEKNLELQIKDEKLELERDEIRAQATEKIKGLKLQLEKESVLKAIENSSQEDLRERDEKRSLESDCCNINSTRAGMRAMDEKAKSALETSLEQVAALQSLVEQLQQERKEAINALQSVPESSPVVTLQVSIEQLQQELEVSHSQVGALRSSVVRMRGERNQLKDALEAISNASIDTATDLRSSIQHLEQERDDLRDELESMDEAFQEEAKAAMEAMDEVVRLQNERDQQRQELTLIKASFSSLEEREKEREREKEMERARARETEDTITASKSNSDLFESVSKLEQERNAMKTVENSSQEALRERDEKDTAYTARRSGQKVGGSYGTPYMRVMPSLISLYITVYHCISMYMTEYHCIRKQAHCLHTVGRIVFW